MIHLYTDKIPSYVLEYAVKRKEKTYKGKGKYEKYIGGQKVDSLEKMSTTTHLDEDFIQLLQRSVGCLGEVKVHPNCTNSDERTEDEAELVLYKRNQHDAPQSIVYADYLDRVSTHLGTQVTIARIEGIG